MAEPANNPSSPASGRPSEPKENGQGGAEAGGEHQSSRASEGREGTDSAGGRLHRSFTSICTLTRLMVYILTLASKPNGATHPDTTNKDSAAENEDQDGEMKDPAGTGEATATPATAQTPASGKKASNGSSKKKAAVPEHKTKKLNKKASAKRLTNLDAQPGQHYLARMKGHPPWPSVICDEEMLPMNLLDTRPVTTKLPDGTYKKAEYADGGKRVHDRTFPIMFL